MFAQAARRLSMTERAMRRASAALAQVTITIRLWRPGFIHSSKYEERFHHRAGKGHRGIQISAEEPDSEVWEIVGCRNKAGSVAASFFLRGSSLSTAVARIE